MMKLVKYDLMYPSDNEEASAFSIVHNHALATATIVAPEEPEEPEDVNGEDQGQGQ